ncbi:hypothetical protein OH687_34260 [Burkholderia anthina]|nr:hypothetical protein OH687_34260 [Burkholderia anthina]
MSVGLPRHAAAAGDYPSSQTINGELSFYRLPRKMVRRPR